MSTLYCSPFASATRFCSGVTVVVLTGWWVGWLRWRLWVAQASQDLPSSLEWPRPSDPSASASWVLGHSTPRMSHWGYNPEFHTCQVRQVLYQPSHRPTHQLGFCFHLVCLLPPQPCTSWASILPLVTTLAIGFAGNLTDIHHKAIFLLCANSNHPMHLKKTMILFLARDKEP